MTLLKANEIAIPESVKVRHNIITSHFDDNISIDDFFNVCSTEESAREICTAIRDLDFIYFRFYGLHILLKDSTNIKARIQQTKDDIENQIYRIYKIRNHIVHAGFIDKINNYAINHLSDYLSIILIHVFETIKQRQHLTLISLDDILLSSQLVIDNLFSRIEKKEYQFKINDLYVPTII